jgi:hypothetical protein
MEKKTIKVNVSRSKALANWGNLFLTLAIINGCLFIVVFCVYFFSDKVENLSTALLILMPVIPLLFCSAVCYGFTEIIKTSLYKRAALEQKYIFNEVDYEAIQSYYDNQSKEHENETKKLIEAIQTINKDNQ